MTTPEVLAQVAGPLATDVLRLMEEVRAHPVFLRLRSLRDVRIFMEHHVWAVWDFMSLLKSVQAAIAPVTVPWSPPRDVAAARLINEIVVAEEGDEAPDGGYASHFEIYLRAMKAADARTTAVEDFVSALRSGAPWRSALAAARMPAAARDFVAATLELTEASVPERVAAFTLGREDVIPGMFRRAIDGLQCGTRVAGSNLSLFAWYLDRHVALDGDHHGPLGAQLFRRVCLVDRKTQDAAMRAAIRSLEHRVALWDAAAAACEPTSARRPVGAVGHTAPETGAAEP